MSTPTQPRSSTLARRAAVPRPRAPVEPLSTGAGPDQGQQVDHSVGMFDLHAWLVPALGIATTVAVFVSMVLLTWVAGGVTPFNR
jgi:hypothetical protein